MPKMAAVFASVLHSAAGFSFWLQYLCFSHKKISGNLYILHKPFNDLALDGVRRAASELGITYDQVEPKSVADEEIIQDERALCRPGCHGADGLRGRI